MKKEKKELVSIVIATYNSSRTLEKVLRSIQKQSYSRKNIEILIIDGGSKDKTIEISKKYRCKLFHNPKIDQVYAKYMGYVEAKGKYLLFLDSDEILENRDSIKAKVEMMTKDKRIRAVVSAGYNTSSLVHPINNYLSEFGDPFSFFMYRNSKDPKHFLKDLVNKYKKNYDVKSGVVFSFYGEKNPPFIELTSMGCLIDRAYVKKMFPDVFRKVWEHTHLFYLLNSKKASIAVMNDDVVLHDSAPTFSGYLKKIRSRVKSNLYSTKMGKAGFIGRERFFMGGKRIKKYLFIGYSLSVIFPLIDAVYLSLSRKKMIYLVHPFLCVYSVILIIYYYSLKTFGVKINLQGYGN